MTQIRGANVAASVRQRLLDQARTKRVDFNLLLTRYGLKGFFIVWASQNTGNAMF